MDGDLISRSALKEDLLNRSFYPAIVKNALENAPAVDAVEVVRCKDCVKCDHEKETPVEGGIWICHLFRVPVHKKHFCSYGERREENAAD